MYCSLLDDDLTIPNEIPYTLNCMTPSEHGALRFCPKLVINPSTFEIRFLEPVRYDAVVAQVGDGERVLVSIAPVQDEHRPAPLYGHMKCLLLLLRVVSPYGNDMISLIDLCPIDVRE